MPQSGLPGSGHARSSKATSPVAGLLGAAALLAVLAGPQESQAQVAEADGCRDLPGGNVRWIVPFSPGGGFDTYSRLLAPFIEDRLGRALAIDNVSGAGGLVGSKAIRDAVPDGLSLGVINAGGLMVASLGNDADVPVPVRDFAILGRVADQRYVWVVAQDSSLATIEEVIAAGEAGSPAVLGIQDAGSASFVAGVLAATVAGIELDYVAGYRSSSDRVLALLRGEIDLSGAPFETYLKSIEAGDVRPVLQVSEAPISEHPSLEGVPVLKDLAVRRAAVTGIDPDQAATDASTVAELTGAGLILVAPAGLAPDLVQCWRDAIAGALADPDFREAAMQAGRSVNSLGGEAVARLLDDIAGRLEPFAAVIDERNRDIKG